MDIALDGPLPPIQLDGDGYRLRPFVIDDLPTIEEASRDPFIPLITTVPSVYTEAAGAAFVARQASRLVERRGWPLAIDVDGRAVGQIGLWIDNLRLGRADLGYWLVGSARGTGIAARALQRLTRWAFDELDRLHRASVFVEPWNVASITTAERAGYAREAILRDWQTVGGEPKDMWAFALTRTDHQRNHPVPDTE